MSPSSQIKRAHHGLEDLPFCLVRAAVAFRRMNDCALREVGMRPQPLGAGSVLHSLYEENSCNVNSLFKRTQLPNGTLTGVLDGLERDGLIRRVNNVDDGRSWLIQLTPEGENKMKTVMKRHKIIMDVFDSALTPAESASLKRALHRLTEAMNGYVSARRPRLAKPKTVAAQARAAEPRIRAKKSTRARPGRNR